MKKLRYVLNKTINAHAMASFSSIIIIIIYVAWFQLYLGLYFLLIKTNPIMSIMPHIPQITNLLTFGVVICGLWSMECVQHKQR